MYALSFGPDGLVCVCFVQGVVRRSSDQYWPRQ